MRAASGPLSRTTPIPPRPGGVAMATIVSAVENMSRRKTEDGRRKTGREKVRLRLPFSLSLLRNNHCLEKSIPDALGRHRWILRDGEVHDTAGVRIERAHFLRSR